MSFEPKHEPTKSDYGKTNGHYSRTFALHSKEPKQPRITESFEWMAPEWTALDAGKNTIRIRGVAMKGDSISKNHRKYVIDELKRSARTWVGKPILANHDPKRIVGNVTWMEFSDKSNALEYFGDVNRQPYVTLIREKSADVRGVSVGADYLNNICPKCAERGKDVRFYSEKEFHDHMAKEHFIRTDPTSEPHGIIGRELSLVLAPELCGADTTLEALETAGHGFNELCEMVMKDVKVGEEMDGKLKEEVLHDGKDTTLTAEAILAKVRGQLKPDDKTVKVDLEKTIWTGQEDGHPKLTTIDDDAVRKALKVATENMSKVETELDGLADKYNESAATLNKWTATKNEELKLKMAEVQTAKEEIQVAQEAVQVKIETLKARETEVEAKQKEIQLQIADMQGLIIKGLAEVATLRESIPERKQLLALAETQQILYENARDKLHGSFKGRQQQIERQSTTYEDPMKQMRESLKGK